MDEGCFIIALQKMVVSLIINITLFHLIHLLPGLLSFHINIRTVLAKLEVNSQLQRYGALLVSSF
jgi:hypothetical protein